MCESHQLKCRINGYAIDAFRDVADQDYISARMSFDAELYDQFFWQSLQAMEKYFKAILLLNRIKAKKLGHSLSKALDKTNELPFEISLSKPTYELIKHLDKFAYDRYRTTSYNSIGAKLPDLDRAV